MKYMGNKQRIAEEILKAIFANSKPTDTFVDLFCGSCSVTEHVPGNYHKVANDKNIYLIEMFKSLVEGRKFSNTLPKEHYSRFRDLYNKHKNGNIMLSENDIALVGWYGWMGSYNGRFFSGGYSGHNVMTTNGKPRDYIREQIANTLKGVAKLRDVQFVSKEYYEVEIPHGSIVYCDPPYKGTKQYETSKDFDYEKFYDWIRENKENYQIFVSEYWMPEDFKCIWQKEVTNSMNQTKTYKPTEKLFTL